MSTDCLFCKIINGEVPAKIIYEDDLTLAFDDIHPKAPVHKLIVPKTHISTLNDLEPRHEALVGHMALVAAKLARDFKVDKNGYRILVNCNKDAGQVIFHLHMHVIGGRSLTWPPG